MGEIDKNHIEKIRMELPEPDVEEGDDEGSTDTDDENEKEG